MNDTQSTGEPMGVTEIADAIGISRATVIADISAKILPATKIGKTFHVRRDDATFYIQGRIEYHRLQAQADAALAGLRKAMRERADRRAAARGEAAGGRR